MIRISNKEIQINGEVHKVGGIEEYSIDRGYRWDPVLQRHVPDGMAWVELKWKSQEGVLHHYVSDNIPFDDIVLEGDIFSV